MPKRSVFILAANVRAAKNHLAEVVDKEELSGPKDLRILVPNLSSSIAMKGTSDGVVYVCSTVYTEIITYREFQHLQVIWNDIRYCNHTIVELSC